MRDIDLWARLASHDFAMLNGKTLTQQLTLQTALSPQSAERAVQEYRRFAYLVQVSGRVLAPSPLIDAVWHLHLQDTRTYFDGFCAQVLRRTMHHIPGRPPARDDEAYLATLDLYAEEFEQTPDAKLWPRPETLRWGARLDRSAPLFSIFLVAALLFQAWLVMAFGLIVATGAAIWWQRVGPWRFADKSDGAGCGGCGGA